MGFLSRLFGKKKPSGIFSEDELVEAGACPNCWGHHSYDGEYTAFVKDQTKSNINADQRKAFVQQFIETGITGIRLKRDGDQQLCPACQTKYKRVSSKAN